MKGEGAFGHVIPCRPALALYLKTLVYLLILKLKKRFHEYNPNFKKSKFAKFNSVHNLSPKLKIKTIIPNPKIVYLQDKKLSF